ncbi:MAG: hypothetical protein WCG23_09975 [bacterium]
MEKNDFKQGKLLEEKLLNSNPTFDYESELKNQINKEIEDARALEEKRRNKTEFLVETDILKLSEAEKFDKNTIYKVFNRKQKTETFVNGEQAQNLIKYINDYVLMFDHRIIEA